MAIYSATDLNSKPMHSASYGDATIRPGKVTPTAALATGDKLRVCRIAGGTEVSLITVKHASAGTTVPVDIGYEPIDGSTAVPAAFFTAYPLQTAAADGKTLAMTDPVRVEKDSWLTITIGTAVGGLAIPVTAIVEGTLLGVK